MKDSDTGLLLSKSNIELHRRWFIQMTHLLGINVIYRVPKKETKTYTNYGELDTLYEAPQTVGCIFEEHASQKTMRKLGWNAELNDSTTVIHVPYDLPNLQAGCLFIIPSGLDNAIPRIFKVIRMSNIPVYPCSISCELGPVIETTLPKTQTQDFTHSNFNLLEDEE